MNPNGPAGLAIAENGRISLGGSQGRWATERLLASLDGNGNMSPEVLRTNTVLRRDEFIEYDNEVVEGFLPRLRAVADLVGRGLTKPITNAMGKTVLQYDLLGDLSDATVSMSGMVRTDNDRPEWTKGQLPIPITHKDWFLDARELAVSRNSGDPLDRTMTRMSGEKCAELQEKILLNGSKVFRSLPIYGYRTHPQRHTSVTFTGGNWASGSKTGAQFLTDVQAMIAAANDDGFYGPFVIYHSAAAAINLDKDYKDATSGTIRARLLELESVSEIKTLDFMPDGEVVMVSMTRDTVVLVQGEALQNVQWEVGGGFGIEFKAFLIQVPLVRAFAGRSGIVHISA